MTFHGPLAQGDTGQIEVSLRSVFKKLYLEIYDLI